METTSETTKLVKIVSIDKMIENGWKLEDGIWEHPEDGLYTEEFINVSLVVC